MPVDVSPYDALLLVSFGGPEKSADVVPFLQNVTRGRGVPPERLQEVGKHYYEFGGRSPINDQCRDLLAAIRESFDAAGVNIAVYWGNRNWDPYLSDTLAQMATDGVRRAACLLTSAYSSYSGCRQYRENLYDAAAGVSAPRLDRLRHYFNHPGFVQPVVDATVDALDRLGASVRESARLVFVTHSLPTAMNEASGRPTTAAPGVAGFGDGGAYVRQHRDVVDTVAEAVRKRTGVARGVDLVYCSRSGPPHVPWLEPDVNDHLESLAAEGVPAVALIPVGFISDHMEVIYDLDTEARQTAERLGVAFARAGTPGTDPRFVTMVRQLLLERAAVEQARQAAASPTASPTASPAADVVVPRPALGVLGPSWDVCPPGCCANPLGPRPALCGGDKDDR